MRHDFTGFASPAAEYERPPLSLDDLLIRFPLATVFARFEGDAMIEDGILDGDLLVIERAPHYPPGCYVLAFVGDQRLVRKLVQHGDRRYLSPANHRYREIAIDETVELFGRVTHRITHYLRTKTCVHTAS